MSQKRVETGKRWIANVFEQISHELQDDVIIEHWSLEDKDPEYRLCFQIAGQNEHDSIAFTRGTLATCGNRHPSSGSVRSRVEATIRNRLLFLAK
jgi:hypothetical protein